MRGEPYGPELLAAIAARCEADPGREACGFVLRRRGALEVVPVPNVADALHAASPRKFPRTSRDGYEMDPRALLAVHAELAATGGEIVAVWHSHVEAGAYFSEKDQADAVIDGFQVIPGAEHLVLAVHGGRVTEVRRYRFEAGLFVEAGVP